MASSLDKAKLLTHCLNGVPNRNFLPVPPGLIRTIVKSRRMKKKEKRKEKRRARVPAEVEI